VVDCFGKVKLSWLIIVINIVVITRFLHKLSFVLIAERILKLVLRADKNADVKNAKQNIAKII